MSSPPKRYFTISKRFKTTEFDSLSNAVKHKPWLILEQSYSHTHSSLYGNKYDLFDYQFYDSVGMPVNPKMGNWKLTRIERGECRETENHNRYDPLDERRSNIKIWAAGNNVGFADPKGFVKTFVVNDIINSLRFLKKLNNYSDWKNFESREKNE
ncbi:MAG TPA: hypothetical protein VE978_24685 [Chitinophagales bacterium]|nr:hypothetical protein [Chitinophagales bacterium]